MHERIPEPAVGVVDLGGARFKAAVFTLGARPECVWRTSVETGDAVTADDVDGVLGALRAIVAETRGRADRVVGYGAGLLRQARWHDALLPALRDLADEAFVLDPQEEGRLLLLAARRDGVDAGHLLDIGGESVQLVSAPYGGAVVRSWPVGTFAIERAFQLPQGSPLPAYERAAGELRDTFSLTAIPGAAGALAVGTGLIEEFLRGLAPRLDVDPEAGWRPGDLDRAWRFCAALPRERFAEVFPAKPGFLFGADKALLVASVIAEQLQVEVARGTDASVLTGVAWRTLEGAPLR